MPEERGTKNDAGTYRNPSPLPPPAIISGRWSRSHALGLLPIVGIQPLLATLTTLSVCLGSAINESGWNVATEGFCNTPSASTAPAHSAPVRITPRSCLSSVTVRGSSHRTRAAGTVAAGGRSTRCFSVERPLAGLVKKKNEERRYSPSIASITADASDEFCIMYSSPLRVYRSLRCAPFRVYIMKIIRRLPAALGGSHERIHPAGPPLPAGSGRRTWPVLYHGENQNIGNDEETKCRKEHAGGNTRRCAQAPARFSSCTGLPAPCSRRLPQREN